MTDTIEVEVNEPTPEDELAQMRQKLEEAQQREKALQEDYQRVAENSQRLTNYITQSLEQGYGGGPAAPEPPAPKASTPEPASEPPDRHEDPDGYIDWMVNQRVQKAIKENVEPLRSTYEQDRRVMFGTAESTAIQSVRSRFSDFASLEKRLRTD